MSKTVRSYNQQASITKTFKKFLESADLVKVSNSIGVSRTTPHFWLTGRNLPQIDTALKLLRQKELKKFGIKSLDDIYTMVRRSK